MQYVDKNKLKIKMERTINFTTEKIIHDQLWVKKLRIKKNYNYLYLKTLWCLFCVFTSLNTFAQNIISLPNPLPSLHNSDDFLTVKEIQGGDNGTAVIFRNYPKKSGSYYLDKGITLKAYDNNGTFLKTCYAKRAYYLNYDGSIISEKPFNEEVTVVAFTTTYADIGIIFDPIPSNTSSVMISEPPAPQGYNSWKWGFITVSPSTPAYGSSNKTSSSSNVSNSDAVIGLAVTGAVLYGLYKAFSGDDNSSENSYSQSNEDYAPQSMNGVEIVKTYTYGALAYEHAKVQLRNKNNYDVIVSIELKQNGVWEKSTLSPDTSDWDGYNYSEEKYEKTFKIKANSIRTVGLRGNGSGRPTNVRISYVR